MLRIQLVSLDGPGIRLLCEGTLLDMSFLQDSSHRYSSGATGQFDCGKEIQLENGLRKILRLKIHAIHFQVLNLARPEGEIHVNRALWEVINVSDR